MENLLPDVPVLGATYLLNPSPFPVVGAHAVDLWQVWLNPYPIWEEGPSVTLFWTNLIFACVPRKKLCGFLSGYAHPEIVHSRPRLFKRCIALSTRQITFQRISIWEHNRTIHWRFIHRIGLSTFRTTGARSAYMGILLDLVNIEKLFPRPLSWVCIVGAQSIE